MMDLFTLIKNNDFQTIKSQNWSPDELNGLNSAGHTPLMAAAIAGNYRLVELLKSLGADPEIRDASGRKAVNYAALHGHTKVIIYLIEGGCGG